MVAEGKRGLLYAAAKNSDKMIAELPSAERGLTREGCRRPDQPPRVLPRETGPGMARSLTPPFSSEEHEGARGEGIDPVTPKSQGRPHRGCRRTTGTALCSPGEEQAHRESPPAGAPFRLRRGWTRTAESMLQPLRPAGPGDERQRVPAESVPRASKRREQGSSGKPSGNRALTLNTGRHQTNSESARCTRRPKSSPAPDKTNSA